MPYINVSQEAIHAEKSLYGQVHLLQQSVAHQADQLRSVYEENRKGLGHHDAKLLELLEDLSEKARSRQSVNSLRMVLKLSAANRESHRNTAFPMAGNRSSGKSSGAKAAGGKAAATGWCPANSMTAVSAGPDGKKTVSMRIGGQSCRFSCDKAGMEKAYAQAVKAGDADMMARTSAMYEIETLRQTLELGAGDHAYPQLGGYHRDVKTQDPKGFESHHIPARSVQAVDAEWLPAISISSEDHKLTSSYRGKQHRVYTPTFPTQVPGVSYKDSVTAHIEKGSSGYIDAVKAELYDLRATTDHRYDGGVSAFLDAVIDMLATRGLPDAK